MANGSRKVADLLFAARDLKPEKPRTSPKFNVSINWDDRQFKDCQAAAKALEGLIGLTQPKWVRTPREVKLIPVHKLPDGFEAELTVTYSFDATRTSIKIPYIWWPKMSAEEKQSVDNCLRDLVVHEEGHIEVAKMVYSKFSGKVLGSSHGKVATENDARKDLNGAVETREKAMALELNEKAVIYDNETLHGQRQSNGLAIHLGEGYGNQHFPGGRNVKLDCPGKA